MRKPSQIEADWKAATPGPWTIEGRRVAYAKEVGDVFHYTELAQVTPIESRDYWSKKEQYKLNAQAIANAPTDIKDLLDWVKRASKELADVMLDGVDKEMYLRLASLLDEVKE